MSASDAELNDLLDDALLDFEQTEKNETKPVASASNHMVNNMSHGNAISSVANEPSELLPPVDIFKEFFDDDVSQHLQAEWNQAVQELCEENPELARHLKDFPQPGTSGGVATSASRTEAKNIDEAMKEALKSISEASSKTDDIEGDEEELIKKFLNCNLEEGDNSDPMGMMENIMKSMLSKELLYPPMKEMCCQYPIWLKENCSKLSPEDKVKFEEQLNCLELICKEFESECDDDSVEEQNSRTTRIMDIIQEMQNYGQPPEGLLAANNPLPKPDNCSIS